MKILNDDNINLKLLVILTRCVNSVHKKEMKTIKRNDVTISQFGVLDVLYFKGDLTIKEIINKTLSTGGNMTVVIKNLEKDGYIIKKNMKQDKRKTLISITAKGKRIIESTMPNHIENVNEIMNCLTNAEKEILITLLKKLGKSQ